MAARGEGARGFGKRGRLWKRDARPLQAGLGKGNFPEEKVPLPAIGSALVDPVVAPKAAGVAQGALGNAVGQIGRASCRERV